MILKTKKSIADVLNVIIQYKTVAIQIAPEIRQIKAIV